MGKKAREKRERWLKGEEKPSFEKESGADPIFLKIIRWATYLILLTPLIISEKYFFPFVGPKSLYFMALAQIIFFSWLLLIVHHAEFRPRLNIVAIALILFLFVFILSAFLGEDFSRSFWSKHERMTGALMWFHLFAFFLVISSVFRKRLAWSKIFLISVFVGLLIALISLLIKAETGFFRSLIETSHGGATLGNSSFMGTYLLFNIFLAFYLLAQSLVRAELRPKRELRIFLLISALIMFWAVYLANARAATLSIMIGLGLLFLLYLSFASSKRYLGVLGKIGLIGVALVFLIIAFYVFQPDNFIHNLFVEKASYARLIVWQISWQAFLERPWLGWGPENFELVFTKHFDPCMFLPACGAQVWFDRAHNAILDTLAANGILGLISYFGIFLSVFYVLWKRYFKEKKDFWTAGIFSAALIAYFIQNLTVFDMISSYMMLFLVLGFVASLSNLPPEEEKKFRPGYINKTAAAIILILFAFSFFRFVVQPLQSSRSVIEAIRTQNPSQRVLLAEKALKTSPLGKYQIKETFVNRARDFYQGQRAENISLKEAKTELDFLSRELEKDIKESPLDFRAYLRLGQVYNLYFQVEPTKLSLAKDALQKAIELSPANQQAYWELAQTYALQGEEEKSIEFLKKAIELEPLVPYSRLYLIRAYRVMEKHEIALLEIKEMEEIGFDWQASPELFKERIEVLKKSGEDINLLIPLYEKGVELMPQDLYLWQDLINAYIETGQVEKAKAGAKIFLELNPGFEAEVEQLLRQLEGVDK